MKHLILALLLAGAPALAHEGDHYYPDNQPNNMGSVEFIDDTINHGVITCYGYSECMMNSTIEIEQGRVVVPHGTQHFYRFPYNNMVTVW